MGDQQEQWLGLETGHSKWETGHSKHEPGYSE
jgi:hypothetical protein